jgi:hypothetical protein
VPLYFLSFFGSYTDRREPCDGGRYHAGAGLRALDALLTGLVDYAGLFPPANEDMRTAVERYASYRIGEDRAALGRFIVPFGRLHDLETVAKHLLPTGPESEPWRLSVLIAGDVGAASETLLKFNSRHRPDSADGHALADVVEIKAASVEEIGSLRPHIPPFFTVYFEIPVDSDLSLLVGTIARLGARAKIRTGGITADAFPDGTHILRFMRACHQHSVAFKATAGLHHPVRGKFRLTYERNSAPGMMYGFLNVFLAAAFVYFDLPEGSASAVLQETDPEAFAFSDDAISWRDITLNVEQVRALRTHSATSFGSCSFREPVDEIASLSGHSLAQNR